MCNSVNCEQTPAPNESDPRSLLGRRVVSADSVGGYAIRPVGGFKLFATNCDQLQVMVAVVVGVYPVFDTVHDAVVPAGEQAAAATLYPVGSAPPTMVSAALLQLVTAAAAPLLICRCAYRMLVPDAKAPATPLSAASSASDLKSTNFGNAVAARIPRITMTTISSMRVKPLAFM
jgi:hypothetical protein